MALTALLSLKRSMALLAAATLLAGPLQPAFAQQVAPPVPAQGAQPATPPRPGAGPTSVADLANQLLDSVVNISTSQNVKDKGGEEPAPRIPQGSPFQEFFDDFFKGDNDGSGAHRVNSLGSGFVIDPAGFIVTNNHVIEGADDIEVVFPNGSKLKAKLVGTDTKTDLSVLKVEPKAPLKAVKFGDSRVMRIGDWVMAIGNPFGLGGSVTLGIISARGRNINAGPYDNFIQTDAAINKGNSGGPLFNMYGEVIGINTAIISPSGGSIGIGFAVPTELAQNVVKQLIEFGETRRGWLGVRIQPVTDDIVPSLGLDRARGALIAGIVKGGPVENGPIKTGDVVVKFDGKDVPEMRDLLRIVAESPVGQPLDVVVMRDGKEQTLKVTLGQLEDDADASAKSSDPNITAPEGDENAAPDDNQDQGEEDTAPDAEDQSPARVLGMTLQPITEAARKSFKIAESVEGILIAEVAPGSLAAEKGLKKGEVIVEASQVFMTSPSAVAEKVSELKSEGRRNINMMIASANGDLRFVAVPME